ncbi:DNA-binding protein [Synergistales bacterium]|nr:DNA-binding protein [Synergistales bacterium]
MNIGERIHLYRTARGWSLDDLADHMQSFDNGGTKQRVITKQALSKYESGKMSPSPKMLNILGKVFGVKGSNLLDETEINVRMIAYRKKNSTSCRDEETALSQAKLRMEQGLKLQTAFGRKNEAKFSLPNYHVESLEDVESAAMRLRKEWDLGMYPIRNMSDLLTSQDIHVLLLSLEFSTFDGFSSWIYRESEDDKLSAAIVVSSGMTLCRHRFTLAHELGHLILNCALTLDEEKVCHRFAGAFLIPEETLKADFGEVKRTVELDELMFMKERYGASIQCLLRRLEYVGLISSAHHNEWRALIRKNNWSIIEPGDEMQYESSPLTQIWATRGLKEGIINRRESLIYLGGRYKSDEAPRRRVLKELSESEIEEINNYYSSDAALEWEAIN